MSSAPRRILELDAVRGIAAFCVVLYHYTTRYGEKVGHQDAPWFTVPWGHYGVELFFLLSGFVIFMTLKRTARTVDFVVSRASRLYPGYWVGMAVTLAAIALAGAPFEGYAVGASDVVVNATMLQRYVPGAAMVDGAYWTLCVELTFYGLIMGLFWAGSLTRIRGAILVLLGLEVALHWITRGGDLSAPLALRALRQVLLGHYGPYFGAGILFYLMRDATDERERFLNVASIGLCLIAVWIMRPFADALASTLCFGIFALLVGGALTALANRPMLFLGAVSYSLYVVHQNVGFLVIQHATRAGINTNLAIGLAILTALAIATLITYGVERPAQRGIRRVYDRWKTRGKALAEAKGEPLR
jgi:peptidoglycan/LPS O-acetylase OafA/YrhL